LPAAQAKRGPVFPQRPSPVVQAHPVRRSAPPPVPARHPARTGTVQARYKLQGGTEEGLLLRLLAMDKAQAKPLGEETLRECVRILRQGTVHHGAVHVDNEQQVALLYWNAVRVSRRFEGGLSGAMASFEQDLEEHSAQVSQVRDELNKVLGVYKLAIIGSGSSAAYYLDTLGPTYDHSCTMVLGKENPWAGRRGLEAIPYINHTPLQIGFPSQGVPRFTTEFYGRAEFAETTRRVIAAAVPEGNWFNEKITRISKEHSGLYVIESKDTADRTHTRRARKVVMATGAGSHAKPKLDYEEGTDEVKPRIVDMDTFVREIAPSSEKITGNVIVQGPNAAIDAVYAAQRYGWGISWFINSSLPIYLPGTRYYLGRVALYKPGAKDAKPSIARGSRGSLRVTYNVSKARGDHQFRPRDLAWDPAGVQVFDVDYLVYGIGQEPGFVGGLLSQDIKEALEPIYDRGARFAPVSADEDFTDVYHDPDEAYLRSLRERANWSEQKINEFRDRARGGRKVALGLHVRGGTGESGFEIFGAAAKAMIGDTNWSKERKEEVGNQLKSVADLQSADILAYEQLGGIRAAMYGRNEYTPSGVVREVDFSHADPTVLRMYIASKYPHVSERDAREVINTILRHRKTGHHPHGYDDWWINHWEEVLARRNEWGRPRRTR
jgi:hypothetical protein